MTVRPGAGLYLILFDMDGTLIDGAPAICSAMEHAFGAIGRAPPESAAVRRVIGLDLDKAILRLAPDLSPQKLAEAIEAYRHAFVTARAAGRGEAGSPLYPGVRAMLERLTATPALLGVATGKARRGLEFALAAHDLERFFATLHCASDGPGKPHPAMIERALERTGAAAADTVVVGDSTYDMEMATNAGARALGVAWGYHESAALLAAGAEAVIEDADALDAALDRLWGPAWRAA